MNRWAERHAAILERDLLPDEQLLAAHRVQLAAVRGPEQFDALRTRGITRRVDRAQRAGFNVPGVLFVLGITNRRVVIWRASRLLAVPQEEVASLPLEDVAAVPVVHRWGRVRVAVVRNDQSMLVMQPLWARKLDELAAAFDDASSSASERVKPSRRPRQSDMPPGDPAPDQ